jgi:aminoglycoside phosphotransferase (APT) family kinase protein
MTRALSPSTAEEVRAWLGEALPAREAATSVRRLGEGLDHVAWLVDDALVVRVSKPRSDAPDRTRHEAALLELVGQVSPIPTPRVVFASAEQRIVVYTFLPGTPLLARATPPASGAAKQLGELLTAVHSVPRERVAHLVEVDEAPLEDWIDEARASWPLVRSIVPGERIAAVDAFLSSAPPSRARRRVLCHNDLGSEHLLVNAEDHLTGVLDWSDAALADPAVDFSRLHRDFGPDFVRAVRDHYDLALDDASAEDEAGKRIWFYARCSVIEDLAFARATNDARYRDAAVRAMRHLFVG